MWGFNEVRSWPSRVDGACLRVSGQSTGDQQGIVYSSRSVREDAFKQPKDELGASLILSIPLI
jgi:hypothetical protein